MISRPVVDATDLLEAIQEALWLTLMIDLHLASRRDPDLVAMAESLGWTVQELDLVWSRSVADAALTPRVLPTWATLRREATAMQEQAEIIHGALAQMEPDGARLDEKGSQGGHLPGWAEAARRNRERLAIVWRLLAEALNSASDDCYPSRLRTDRPLNVALGQIRQDLLPALSFPVDPHRDPRGFLQRRRQKMPEPLARHLTQRIADTWKVQRSKLKRTIGTASTRLEMSTRAVKEHYVRPHLWPPMKAFCRPQHVKIGHHYKKRQFTPVRSGPPGPRDAEDVRTWGQGQVQNMRSYQKLPRARLWPDDVPVYRTWKWIVNKAINGAAADVIREYGETDDPITGAASLDDHPGKDGEGLGENRTLHELIGARGGGRQLEAIVAQEQLDAGIERVCCMLDSASDQQREVILARIDPDLAPHVNERQNLKADERELAETECDGWREIAEAAGVSSGGHAHRQYRRAEAKLDD